MVDEAQHDNPKETHQEWDPSAANYRRLAMVFLFVSLMLPTLLAYGPRGLRAVGYSIAESYQLVFYLLALFILVLAYSREAGRNWKALDRGFGALLLVTGMMIAWDVVTIQNDEGSGQEYYLPETYRWIQMRMILTTGLWILAGAFCFRHIAWVWPMLLVFAAVGKWTEVHPDAADGPLGVRNQLQVGFHQAVGKDFHQEYYATRSPEQVKELFLRLDEPALDALRAWIGEDGVAALLENGDDTLYLRRTLAPELRAFRTEGGRLQIEPLAGDVRKTERPPFHFILSTNLLMVTVMLYSVWRAYRVRFERRMAAAGGRG